MKNYPLSLLAILAIGCSGSSDAPATTATTGTDAAPKTTATTAPEGTAPKPVVSEVPAAVKTDAYSYFGLDNAKTMNVEMRVKGRPTITGAVTAKLSKVEGETATYTIERTGGIEADLGTDTILVDKTGVYIVGTTVGSMTPAKSLQLPSDLKPGASWTTESKVSKTDGTELTENGKYVVKGTEKLTTKVGTYDALVVTSTGTGTVKVQGKTNPATYNATSYYVKDRGLVKQIINLTLQGQPSNSVTIEESK